MAQPHPILIRRRPYPRLQNDNYPEDRPTAVPQPTDPNLEATLLQTLAAVPDLPENVIRPLLKGERNGMNAGKVVGVLAYMKKGDREDDGDEGESLSGVWPDVRGEKGPASWSAVAGVCGVPSLTLTPVDVAPAAPTPTAVADVVPSSSTTIETPREEKRGRKTSILPSILPNVMTRSRRKKVKVLASSPEPVNPLDLIKRVSGGPPREVVWPLRKEDQLLPAEMIDIILAHLSRDDLKALRLTCTTLREIVSDKFFKSVVVPFNAGIYGMLLPMRKKKERDLLFKDVDAKVDGGRALDVFAAFGHKVKKFGMTFEVKEADLSSIPSKGLYEHVTAYWGQYDWPLPDYQRFNTIATLENAADETPSMKSAFSRLKDVRELALSIDSGMGYLHGPDVSLYDQIFNRPKQIFGPQYALQDRRLESQDEFWAMLRQLINPPSTTTSDANNTTSDGTFFLFSSTIPPVGTTVPRIPDLSIRFRPTPMSPATFNQLVESNVRPGLATPSPPLLELSAFRSHHVISPSREERSWILNSPSECMVEFTTANRLSSSSSDSDFSSDESRFEQFRGRLLDSIALFPNLSRGGTSGIAVIRDNSGSEISYQGPNILTPCSLTKAQMEWLLETEWAQQAFISSYVLAIMDNPNPFMNVHNVNLARMSSQYLPMLNRKDFWTSLPQLEQVTVLAIARWRSIDKDVANYVNDRLGDPLESAVHLEDIVRTLSQLEGVKTMNIGWASGGEHETGYYGRNQHLMPAPIMPKSWICRGMIDFESLEVSLPHVENLTITNCWIAPTPLVKFVQMHSKKLKSLTLNSVSLTKQPNTLPWIAQRLNSSGAVVPPQPQPFNAMHLHPGNVTAWLAAMTPAQLQAFNHTHLPNLALVAGMQPNAVNAQLLFNPPAPQVHPQFGGAQGVGLAAFPAPPPPPNQNMQQIFQQLAAQPPPVQMPQPPQPTPQPLGQLGPYTPGSWPWMLEAISPLPKNHLPLPATNYRFSTQPLHHQTPTGITLKTLTLTSCGYARLANNTNVDQETLIAKPLVNLEWPRVKHIGAKMLAGGHLGFPQYGLAIIAQSGFANDYVGLEQAWGCSLGPWEGEGSERAMFDGWEREGSGRFRGVIRREEEE